MSLPEIARPEATASDRALGHRITSRLQGDLQLAPVVISIVVIWLVFFSMNSNFLSPRNLSNLTLQIVVTALLSLGLVFVLLIAEIDLSVAALSAASAALMANLVVNFGLPPIVGILAALVAGVIFGLLQAVIIMYGVPSLIVTLGGSLVLAGVLLILLPEAGQINLADTPLKAIAGTYLPPAVGWIAAAIGVAAFAFVRFTMYRAQVKEGLPSRLLTVVVVPSIAVGVFAAASVAVLNTYRGVPAIGIGLIVLLGVLSWVMRNTRFGLHIYATGGSRTAARRAGIPVRRVILSVFAIAGLFAAAAGIVASSRLLGVSTAAGGGTLLLGAIAAAVIGGTSLFGGKGSVWAALLGALVIGSISNGMDLMGLSSEAKLIVQGLVLVLAATLDLVLTRGSFKNLAEDR